jgi:aldose 1-epimerase
MYAALVARRFEELRRSAWRLAVMRSGLLIMMTVAVMLVVLAFGWRAHTQGRFGRLKAELKHDSSAAYQPVTRPGGQDPIVLGRIPPVDGAGPEFLSATLLPGRGMNVLQIKAYVPNKGEVDILDSQPVEEASQLLDGNGADTAGGASLTMGGAVEVPWANRMSGIASPGGASILTIWRGHPLTLPLNMQDSSGSPSAGGGLLLRRAADSVKNTVMPDGGEAEATFKAGNFDGHWISRTEVTTSVQLSSRAIEVMVLARNAGNQAMPIGIGWHPRFAVRSKHREQVALRLPNGLRAEVADRRSGLPSGRLIPVAGTQYDFTAGNGSALGKLSLDDCFVHLRPGLLDSGPIAELRDPEAGYGLRLTAMTPTIKAFRVHAPADANFVTIEPQSNYDDPFGHEWPKDEDTGMVVLQPGASVRWMVRLEIFSLTADSAQRF